MAEAVAVIEDQTPIDTLTVVALRNLCKQLGITGYSGMKKDEIIAAIQAKRTNVIEVKAPTLVDPVQVQTIDLTQEVKEAPKTWELNFIEELRNVCINLEELPTTNFLPEELLATITLVKEATKVEDLAHLTDEILQTYVAQIKQQLPRFQRDVFETVTLIARATPIHVDVDFV